MFCLGSQEPADLRLDLLPISPEAHAYALDLFRKARSGNTWTPPSQQGTVIFPGFNGGTNWGGASFDPATGWFYVNTHDEPWLLTMVPAKAGARYPYNHTGYIRFLDAEGYPAIKEALRKFVMDVMLSHPTFKNPKVASAIRNLPDAPPPHAALKLVMEEVLEKEDPEEKAGDKKDGEKTAKKAVDPEELKPAL